MPGCRLSVESWLVCGGQPFLQRLGCRCQVGASGQAGLPRIFFFFFLGGSPRNPTGLGSSGRGRLQFCGVQPQSGAGERSSARRGSCGDAEIRKPRPVSQYPPRRASGQHSAGSSPCRLQYRLKLQARAMDHRARLYEDLDLCRLVKTARPDKCLPLSL